MESEKLDTNLDLSRERGNMSVKLMLIIKKSTRKMQILPRSYNTCVIYLYINDSTHTYIEREELIYIKLEITMTRKSGTHLHVRYGAVDSCFDLIRSHQQCTPWSPPLEIEPTTTVYRSWNSTTRLLVHATYKRCRINKSWQIARPLDLMCLFL